MPTFRQENAVKEVLITMEMEHFGEPVFTERELRNIAKNIVRAVCRAQEKDRRWLNEHADYIVHG